MSVAVVTVAVVAVVSVFVAVVTVVSVETVVRVVGAGVVVVVVVVVVVATVVVVASVQALETIKCTESAWLAREVGEVESVSESVHLFCPALYENAKQLGPDGETAPLHRAAQSSALCIALDRTVRKMSPCFPRFPSKGPWYVLCKQLGTHLPPAAKSVPPTSPASCSHPGSALQSTLLAQRLQASALHWGSGSAPRAPCGLPTRRAAAAKTATEMVAAVAAAVACRGLVRRRCIIPLGRR